MLHFVQGRVTKQDDDSDFDPDEGNLQPDYEKPSSLLTLKHGRHPVSLGKGFGGGSRRRSYRKSRKLRKSKVRVRLSKSRRHRRSRRGRRH